MNNTFIPISAFSGASFFIPSYQRGYRWTRSQVEDLLNDFKEFHQHKKEGDFYCLQPLIVSRGQTQGQSCSHASGGDTKESTIYRVIDGQQRLTTVWLLENCLLLRNNLQNQPYFSLSFERDNQLDKIQAYNIQTMTEQGNITSKNTDQTETGQPNTVSTSVTRFPAPASPIVQKTARKNITEWDRYISDEWKAFSVEDEWCDVETYHLFAANAFIQNWLDANDAREVFSHFIHEVKVIWHEVPSNKEVETFQNLNSGKIPLTDAELIKAVFLGRHVMRSVNAQVKQSLIAEEFDRIEQQLRQDDFWYFLNGAGAKPSSCIGFIFELLQQLETEPTGADDNDTAKVPASTYFFFHKYINTPSDVNSMWEKVSDIYHTLLGWYNTPVLYNLIGYLRGTGTSMKSIYKKYLRVQTIEEFKVYLTDECFNKFHYQNVWNAGKAERLYKLMTHYRFDQHKSDTFNLLFFLNIATLNSTTTGDINRQRDVTKFSFSDFHNCSWHIEHISPNNAVYKERLSVEPFFKHLPKPEIGTRLKELNDYLNDINPYIAVTDESVMSLPNLTLLSSHINESIGNNYYDEKRMSVIQKQSEGFYVLPSTLMIFTKGYVGRDDLAEEIQVGKFNYWSDKDREAYLKKIDEILVAYYFQNERSKLSLQEKEKKEEKEKGNERQSFCPPFFGSSEGPKASTNEHNVSTGECETVHEISKNEQLVNYTFQALIESYDYIIIPKIQRDYAQGRNSASDERAHDVRKKLLNDIFALKGNETLDFQIIFGTTEKRLEITTAHSSETISPADTAERLVFIPIDGQQRLTTLFLLQLYLDKRIQSGEQVQSGILTNQQSHVARFIYETRKAATDFCIHVVRQPWIEFPLLKPSEAIKNATWFKPHWQQDPTVSSMLHMLDSIHKHVQHTSDGHHFQYPDLTKIQFAFFDLGTNDVSETIYLKMNSRGKELTPFENLKASIEKAFGAVLTSLESRQNDDTLSWKKNIDSRWRDAFWNSEQPAVVPDYRLIRFIANILFVSLCEGLNLDAKKDTSLDQAIENRKHLDKDNETGVKERNKLVLASYLLEISNKKSNEYIAIQPFIDAIQLLDAQHIFPTIAQMLNAFNKTWEDTIRPAWGWGNGQRGTSLLDNNYTQRSIFYALLLYYQSGKKDLSEWMRFVWNIAENSENSFIQFTRTCKLFKAIIDKFGNRDILEVLQTNEALSLSKSEQFIEEVTKAQKSDDSVFFEHIKQAEKHAFFHGAIRHLFAPTQAPSPKSEGNPASIHDEMPQGTTDPWEQFETKVMNLAELVPCNASERKTVSLLIPYLPKDRLKKIFEKYYLSNEGTNLKPLFLDEQDRPYFHRFFTKAAPLKEGDNGYDKNFHNQLSSLAESHPHFFIMNNWSGAHGTFYCVLTDYSGQRGYFDWNSFILDDPMYYQIQKVLKHEPFKPHIEDAFKTDAYLVGLNIHFEYNGHRFVYFYNHSIGLVGATWQEVLLTKSLDVVMYLLNSKETLSQESEIKDVAIDTEIDVETDRVKDKVTDKDRVKIVMKDLVDKLIADAEEQELIEKK